MKQNNDETQSPSSAKLRFNFETAKSAGVERSGAERKRSGSGETPKSIPSGSEGVKIFSQAEAGESERRRGKSSGLAY